MYNILVSNDDGIQAPGIRKLVLSLASYAKVYVSAPARQQSAKSMGLTLHEPLEVTEERVPGAEFAYSVDGTPADCVKFGIYKCLERGVKPDYVIAGINMGANLGADAHYSGTVACAMEGALSGYKSIALSVVAYGAAHYDYICDMVPELLRLSDEVGPETVLNVNVPDAPSWEIKGVKLVPTGDRGFDVSFVKKDENGSVGNAVSAYDSMAKASGDNIGTAADETGAVGSRDNENNGIEGIDQYTYNGFVIDYSQSTEENDLTANLAGYATITPLTLEMTDHRKLQSMRRLTSQKMVCVFVDYQEKLIPAIRNNEEIVKASAKFARCAKALGLPVIVTQQYTQGLGVTIPEISNALGGVYEKVEKVEFSCMDSPHFREKMMAAQGKTVVIAGIESHICVQATAMDLLAAGYEVIVLADCCGSRSKLDHSTAMRYLQNAGCEVTTYESLVYRLMGSSKHSEFKTIANIVKE